MQTCRFVIINNNLSKNETPEMFVTHKATVSLIFPPLTLQMLMKKYL